jgi:hypothetical protein
MTEALDRWYERAAAGDPTAWPGRVAAPKTARALQFIPFEDLRVSALSSSYLVKHLIPRVGMVVVWGPPKCGKASGSSIWRCT